MKAEKVYDQTFTARNFNISPLTISGLEGDLYDYKFIIKTDTVGSDTNLLLRCNGDTTSNYRVYYMQGNGSSAAASVDDSGSSIQLNNALGTAQQGFIIGSLTGSSGDERYFDLLWSGDGRISKTSGYRKNTADEVTSFSITASASITVDAHIILYRTPKEASQEKWELVDVQNISAVDISTNPVIFNNLDLDSDKEYKVVWESLTSTNLRLEIRLNNDTGSNYTQQGLRNNGGTIDADNRTQGFFYTGVASTANASEYGYFTVRGDSSVKRLCEISYGSSPASTGYEQTEYTGWWNNLVDNVTEIRLFNDNTATVTGTIKLYRKRNPKTISDTLPFEMVEEESFSSTDWSAGSTYTVSGDDVLLYKIEGLLSNASGDIEIRMELNSDTAANYPEQLLKGDTSTASAASTTRNYIVLAKLQNGDQAHFNHYLYPKSGENRPMLTECSYDENALEKLAQWWNNSADSISSIKIYASSSNAITGTIKLSRLMNKVDFLTYTHSWGGASDIQSNQAEFPGASGDRITVTDSGSTIENAIIGSGDLTIEIDVEADVSQNQSYFGIGNGGAGWPTGTTNGHLFIMTQEGSDTKVQWSKTTTGVEQVIGSSTNFVGAQGRFTYVRDSGRVSIYKDGTRLATTTSNTTVAKTATTGTTTINIGGNAVAGEEMDGRINAIRISSVAMYDATDTSITDLDLINTRNTVYLNTFTGVDSSTPSENTP